MIRKYFDKYTKYNWNKWVWYPYTYSKNCSIEEQEKWNELYLKTRARKSEDPKINKDKVIPDFYSVERDAEQFGLREVTFTDIFGLKWTGKKGCEEVFEAPDYEEHLYYYLEEYGDIEVDYSYDSNKNQPDAETYHLFILGYPRFRKEWIDIKNIVDIKYYYYVENHLFKDSRIEYTYDDGTKDTIYDIRQFVEALDAFEKKDLYEKLMKQINKHFDALKNSEREEEREYYPGCTAEEYFKKGE